MPQSAASARERRRRQRRRRGGSGNRASQRTSTPPTQGRRRTRSGGCQSGSARTSRRREIAVRGHERCGECLHLVPRASVVTAADCRGALTFRCWPLIANGSKDIRSLVQMCAISLDPAVTVQCTAAQQEAVKGSQGAGRVDESLDISKQAISDGPKLPPGKGSRNTAGGGRKKGRR